MDLTPLIILTQLPSMVPQLLMIVFLFWEWFIIALPRRSKQQQKMIGLGSGDKVVTIGDSTVVQSVKDDRVVIKIAEGAKVEVRKSS